MLNMNRYLTADFKKHPMVGEEFNFVSFDLYRTDPEEDLYYLSLRYESIRPDESGEANYIVAGSMHLRTGFYIKEFEEAGKLLSNLISIGFFTQIVTATGYVYDEFGERIQEIRWDQILQLIHQPEQESQYLQ